MVNLILQQFQLVINDYESSKFEISNQSITLEPFIISRKTMQLNEVVIVKKKPIVEVFADKTVFNVQNTLSASGISAFELLRKAPGVVVDNNDNLIVEGKTGVQIYIDGKPSVLSGQDLTNYLKTIQSSDVDTIEIITNPSSKYDAAGNAGIVNIKLKKDKRFGTNGSIAVGYAIGKFGKYNSSLSLNNRTKKVNLFGTYSNQFDETFSFINLYRIQSNTIFDSKTENISNTNANNAKVGLDFFQNKKNTFGIVFNGNFNNNFSNGVTRNPITTIGNLNPNQVLLAESNSKSKTYNIQSNLNYRFADTLGHSINTDFDYGKYRNRRSNFQPNSYFNGNETQLQNQFIYKMNTPIDISILSFKTDYEQNLWKGKLGLGFKSSIVKTDNTFNFYDIINEIENLNSSRSNNFKYSENINALYFNFNRKFNKIDLQFGLRSETTISKGDLSSTQNNQNNSVSRNYTDFFPSAGVTYNPNQNNAWAVNYSKRIERPSYQSLNPFEMQLDELSFMRGNPFLQPQYTDNYKISHTYKYTLNTSLSYSFIKDFFAQVTQSEGANKNFMTTKNVANQEVWNLGVSYPFTVNKWWDVYANVEFSNSSYKGNDANFVSITQNNFNFYASNTFSMPEKIKMEVSGWFSSPSVWGGTYRTKSLGSLDLALQRKFWKDKMNLRLAFSDMLFTSPWSGETRFGDLYISGNGGWESRQFRVNLSYNFGNSNVKSTQKKTGIDDENKRI
jgi:iron complex outermembrane recepter protein